MQNKWQKRTMHYYLGSLLDFLKILDLIFVVIAFIGLGLTGFITLILVAAKAFGFCALSWTIILLPIIIVVSAVVVLGLFAILILSSDNHFNV